MIIPLRHLWSTEPPHLIVIGAPFKTSSTNSSVAKDEKKDVATVLNADVSFELQFSMSASVVSWIS